LKFTREIIISLMIILLIPLGAMSKPLEEKKWIRGESENFEIISRHSKGETVDLLRSLEVFRAVMKRFIRSDQSIAEPHLILALADRKELAEIGGPGRSVAGMFSSGLRQNISIVVEISNMDETQIMLHEYAHFLMRTYSAAAYPTWYQEGFAEFMGTSRVRGDVVELFRAPEGRLNVLLYFDWLDPKQLLDSSEFEDLGEIDTALFYAQAWILVHYLHNRPEGEPTISEGNARYSQLRSTGMGEITAFEEAFELNTKILNRKLANYLNTKCCRYGKLNISDILKNFTPEFSSPTPSQVAQKLGRVALRLESPKSARSWFEVASRDPKLEARALSGVAQSLYEQHEFAAAEQALELAISIAPEDPYLWLDQGNFWYWRAEATEDGDLRAKYGAAASTSYDNAAMLSLSSTELLAMQAKLILVSDGDLDLAVSNLEEAQLNAPSDLMIKLALATAYARIGRPKEAIQMCRTIIRWPHISEETRQNARDLLRKLNESESATASDAQ